jgi:hypothetical protein
MNRFAKASGAAQFEPIIPRALSKARLGPCQLTYTPTRTLGILRSGQNTALPEARRDKPACCWECKSPTRKEKANPSWPRVLRRTSRGVRRSKDGGIGGLG